MYGRGMAEDHGENATFWDAEQEKLFEERGVRQ